MLSNIKIKRGEMLMHVIQPGSRECMFKKAKFKPSGR